VSDQLGPVVDPDPQAPPPTQAQALPPDDPAPPPEPADDDTPEAVEVQPGVKMVPLGVMKAVREENKALKPLAQRAAELEQQVNQFRPYAEFLSQHPHLLQPQPPPQPAPQAQPADDPALADLARTLELYTPEGKPDTTRAAKIRDLTRSEAQAIAQQTIAPVQENTWEQKAASNLQWMSGLKDANGRPLEEQYIVETVRSIYGSLPRTDALRVLADPKVAEVVGMVAIGRQAMSKPHQAAPQAPVHPPLHYESAGGATEPTLSEGSRRLARMVGRTDKEWLETAKKFVPGRANALE